MSLKEEIRQALKIPFEAEAKKQGLDPSEYRGQAVWHDGPTLEKSWIKITRELNTDTGSFKDGKWIPFDDPDAYTYIDVLDKGDVGKGNVGDMNALKNKFNNLRINLPAGKYGINANHPTKAAYYLREWLKHPWFKKEGKGGAKVFSKKTGKVEHFKFDTMEMTVPENTLPGEVGSLKRNAALKKEGVTSYVDENRHKWNLQSNSSVTGQKTWRNVTRRNQTEWALDPNTGLPGTRYAAKRLRVMRRIRGLIESSPDAKEANRRVAHEIAVYNSKLDPADVGAKLRFEHRISQADYKRYNLPGNPADPWNIWVTTEAEWKAKDALEARLRAKNLDGKYLVEFDAEGNVPKLRVVPVEKYTTPGMDPKDISIADMDITGNLDADNKATQNLAQNLGKLPTKAEGVKQLGNVVTNNPVTRGLGIGNDARLASVVENMTDLAKGIPPGARFGLSLLPGLGIAGDAADAAVKHQEAIDDPTLLNKAQDWVAKSVATTSVIPTPGAQAYNFVAGLGLGASDAIEHYGAATLRHLGEKFTDNKGISRLWYQEPETDDDDHTN